jgi:voltage-gated potassium channel
MARGLAAVCGAHLERRAHLAAEGGARWRSPGTKDISPGALGRRRREVDSQLLMNNPRSALRRITESGADPALLDHLSKIAAAIGIFAVALDTWARRSGPSTGFTGNLAHSALVVVWLLFCLEIAARLRAAGEQRWSYVRSAGGLFDLASVVLPVVVGACGAPPRDAVLSCGVWVLKFARESTAVRLLGRVLSQAGRNLLSVMSVFGVVLFLAALVAHVLERDAQPEDFGSIPAALWWAAATLSTTGYGDVVPITPGGRLLAGAVMICGIALFALWAGILASGFADELRRQEFLRSWEMVARVPLFSALDAVALADIVRMLRARRVAAGALICRKGDPGEQMFFVAEGEVEVATPVPVRLGAGDFFGELALITGEPRAATVRAASSASLLVLDISDFRMLMARDGRTATAIRSEADRRLADLRPAGTS